MRGLFSGCFAAFWLQFGMNLARKAAAAVPEPEPELTPEPETPAQSAEDQARVDQILARCKATDEAAQDHDPAIVARWIEFVGEHNLPIVIIGRNRAIVPSLIPARQRVH